MKKDAELNDAFVEGLGVPEIKTVEDLKAYINEGLQQQHDQQYETQKENTIFDAFMADSEVELDDDAIDEALDRQMSYMANQMMAQGIQSDQSSRFHPVAPSQIFLSSHPCLLYLFIIRIFPITSISPISAVMISHRAVRDTLKRHDTI